MMSGLATRQSSPAAKSAFEPRLITHCERAPTVITLDDGAVLEVHLLIGKVTKRFDKLDPQGRPAYDVAMGLRVFNVTKPAKEPVNG
jgi:hypothetical protein